MRRNLRRFGFFSRALVVLAKVPPSMFSWRLSWPLSVGRGATDNGSSVAVTGRFPGDACFRTVAPALSGCGHCNNACFRIAGIAAPPVLGFRILDFAAALGFAIFHLRRFRGGFEIR